MPFTKSSSLIGKKQAPMPGPSSAVYKKIVSEKKAVAAHGAAGKSSSKAGRKRPRSTAAFSSLKTRQMLVERIKREIWASVLKINDAVIKLALAGNFNAAKALFDFAGVYSLPEPEDENANAAVLAGSPQPESAEASDPVDAFFRSIGMPASCSEPTAA